MPLTTQPGSQLWYFMYMCHLINTFSLCTEDLTTFNLHCMPCWLYVHDVPVETSGCDVQVRSVSRKWRWRDGEGGRGEEQEMVENVVGLRGEAPPSWHGTNVLYLMMKWVPITHAQFMYMHILGLSIPTHHWLVTLTWYSLYIHVLVHTITKSEGVSMM